MHKNPVRRTEKVKLLIVDDHAILRAGLKLLLEGEKEFEIAGEASTGKEGIYKNRLLQPDIILLDISLPDMNGLEVAGKILKLTPQVKILVLTMYESEEYLQEFLKLGVKGYVVKKAADKELIEAILAVARGNIFIHSAMAKLLKRQEHMKLSAREKQVLIYLAKGYVNKEIAGQLNLSIKTVETYRARIARKLNLSGRSELTDYAVKTGIINL